MRTALVLDRFDPSHGGLERWAFDLAAWLVRHADEVHVLAFGFGTGTAKIGIVPHRLEDGRSALVRAATVERHLGTRSFDVVHDLGTGWGSDVFQPQFGSRRAGARGTLRAASWPRRLALWVSSARRVRDREQRAVERRQCAEAAIVIAVSVMVRDHLVRLNGVDARRIEVVHNGVDVARFSPERRAARRGTMRRQLGVADDQVAFLLAAHNLRLKGAATAIGALARIAAAAPGARLLVIGRTDPEPYRRLAVRLGVAGRVRFLGFADEPADYYAAADVYLHPTFYDACSLTVLEAWASGLPAITTRANGAAELMASGEHGIVIDDARDVRGLAAAMLELVDGGARLRMGAAARALAEEQSSERNFARISDLYRRFAGGS